VSGCVSSSIESEQETALARPRCGRRPTADAQKDALTHGIPGHRTWPPLAIADGDLWPGRDRDAARQARWRGGQDNRVEEFGAAYLAGSNTRRVRRALPAIFGGAVSKDTVSRVWRKVKGDWDAWNDRSPARGGVGSTGRPPRSCSWSCSACVGRPKSALGCQEHGRPKNTFCLISTCVLPVYHGEFLDAAPIGPIATTRQRDPPEDWNIFVGH
jgi:hypothetical protein